VEEYITNGSSRKFDAVVKIGTYDFDFDKWADVAAAGAGEVPGGDDTNAQLQGFNAD